MVFNIPVGSNGLKASLFSLIVVPFCCVPLLSWACGKMPVHFRERPVRGGSRPIFRPSGEGVGEGVFLSPNLTVSGPYSFRGRDSGEDDEWRSRHEGAAVDVDLLPGDVITV